MAEKVEILATLPPINNQVRNRSGAMSKKDWRKPLDYEFVKSLNLDQLAWEFLRRNPEYRKDWDRELPIYLERERKYRSNPKHKGDPVYKEKILSIDDPMFELNPGKPDYLFKWGMYSLINPDQDKPFFLAFESTYGQIKRGGGLPWLKGEGRVIEGKTLIPTLADAEATVKFNLTLPLKPQIKKAYKDLIAWQEHMVSTGEIEKFIPKVRHDRDLHINYLRILDATTDSSGSMTEKDSVRKIANTTFPNVENQYPELMGDRMVRDSKKAAYALMNGGYRSLIAHD